MGMNYEYELESRSLSRSFISIQTLILLKRIRTTYIYHHFEKKQLSCIKVECIKDTFLGITLKCFLENFVSFVNIGIPLKNLFLENIVNCVNIGITLKYFLENFVNCVNFGIILKYFLENFVNCVNIHCPNLKKLGNLLSWKVNP